MQKKNAGNRAFQNENFALAIKLYTEAIALEPSEHTLYSNRSAAHLLNIDYDAALIDAQKCIQLQPDWQKGYVRKGSVLCKLKQLEEANQTYLNAKQLCSKTDLIQKAMDELEILRMEDLDEDSRMVGGHHAQATKFRTLINWLIQGGAQFPKLYLKFYSPEYRAIHALEDIYVDEDICFIPHDYIMTSDVAKQSEIGQKIIAAKVELRSKHSYLASYLLQEREKGEQSKWHVYITILPRKFETIPLFFNEEQRKALIGSIAIKKIDDRLESLRLEHEAICTGVPEFSRFDLNDFIWARLVVITRIFGLVVEDLKTDGLVPMADMLNHKRPRETKWTYSQEKHGFLITALQNISSNHEIFDSYGRKCNSRFFVNYGFSLEFNLDNEALMSFELPQSDPQFTIKAHHLGYSGHDFVKRDFQIPMQYKEKKVKECFSFLRVLHAQGNEFLIISSSDGLKVTDIPPLSIRNEINVLTSMAVSATRSLQKFETTLQFDNQLLEDEEKYPRFSNPRNAILMRRGEKDVLTNYVHLRKICIPLFKLRYKDLRVRLRRNKRFRDPDSPLMMYVNSVVVPLVQRQSS